MKKLMVVIVALTVAGCGHSAALVQDPKTGAVALCDATAPPIFIIIRQQQVDDCVNGYLQQGWVKKGG